MVAEGSCDDHDGRRAAAKRRTRDIGPVALQSGRSTAVDVDTHVGRMIRRRRRLLGLSQSDLARACGTAFQQIQKYECGLTRLSVARLWLLAGALGVDFGYFFQGLPELRRADDGPSKPGDGSRSFAPSARPARGAA